MSEPQQDYDLARTLVFKVGGVDVRSTMTRIFLALRDCTQLAGPDGIITVTIDTHVPKRRLPEEADGHPVE